MKKKNELKVERYKKVLANPGNCEYYCVLSGAAMVGFLIIEKSQNRDGFFVGEIWAIYLLEEFRGKGNGKMLLEFAVNELKRNDPKEIFLWVFEGNGGARRFYENHNFAFDGTKKEKSTWGGPLTLVRYVLNA